MSSLKSRWGIGIGFVCAVGIAAGIPFLMGGTRHAPPGGVPEASELSRSDAQYVNEQVAEYCQNRVEEQTEYTQATPGSAQVPVIIYHRVTDVDKPSREVIHPDVFKAQMQLLKDKGYTTITVAELTEYMNGKAALPPKPVVLTFDDGWKDNVEAAKLLEEMKLKATFYIISGFFDNDLYMNESDVRRIAKDGLFEIGSHTHTHFVKYDNKLDTLNMCIMAREMAASKHIIERVTKKPVTSIAWPYGYNTNAAVHVASKLGYTSTMMVNRDSFNAVGNPPLMTRRLNIDGNCPLPDFEKMVETKVLKECS